MDRRNQWLNGYKIPKKILPDDNDDGEESREAGGGKMRSRDHHHHRADPSQLRHHHRRHNNHHVTHARSSHRRGSSDNHSRPHLHHPIMTSSPLCRHRQTEAQLYDARPSCCDIIISLPRHATTIPSSSPARDVIPSSSARGFPLQVWGRKGNGDVASSTMPDLDGILRSLLLAGVIKKDSAAAPDWHPIVIKKMVYHKQTSRTR